MLFQPRRTRCALAGPGAPLPTAPGADGKRRRPRPLLVLLAAIAGALVAALLRGGATAGSFCIGQLSGALNACSEGAADGTYLAGGGRAWQCPPRVSAVVRQQQLREDDVPPSLKKLLRLTKAELLQQCREKGLNTVGSKDQLATRIIDAGYMGLKREPPVFAPAPVPKAEKPQEVCEELIEEELAPPAVKAAIQLPNSARKSQEECREFIDKTCMGGVGGRPPSEKQIAFVRKLEQQHGVTAPAEVLSDRRVCSEWLSKICDRGVGGRGVGGQPPSEKQIAFVRKLEQQHGVTAPPEVLSDRKVCSDWISKICDRGASAVAAAPPATSTAQAGGLAPAPVPAKAPTKAPAKAPANAPAKSAARRNQARSPALGAPSGDQLEITAGISGDVFIVPRGSLPEKIWECESSWTGNHYEARSWRAARTGITYVGNIVSGTTYLAASMDGRHPGPPRRREGQPPCKEFDQDSLSVRQYAALYAQLLQEEFSSTKHVRFTSETPTKTVKHDGHEIKLYPHYRFRGMVVESEDGQEKPAMSVTLVHKAIPPPSLNCGKFEATEQVAAALVGMKVLPVPTERGEPDTTYEVCIKEAGEDLRLNEDRRNLMLSYNLTKTSKVSWQRAPIGSLLLNVARDCKKDEMRLTYLAKDLRPTLSERNQQKWKRVPGNERWEPFVTVGIRDVSVPASRSQLVNKELLRFRQQFEWMLPLTRANMANCRFGGLQKPKAVYGRGTKANVGGSRAYHQLKRTGPFHVDTNAKAGKLQCFLVGRTRYDKEVKTAEKLCGEVRSELKQMGLPAGGGQDIIVLDKTDVKSFKARLDELGLGDRDAVVLFGATSLGREAESVREQLKYQCLLRGGEGENRHLASQWIDLSKHGWFKPNTETNIYNVVEQLLAKLGHVPFAIDISHWRQRTSGAQRGTLVAGYDVCHLRGQFGNVDVAAGVRVSPPEAGQDAVLSRIESEPMRIKGETVPGELLRKLVPKQLAAGKVIFIHRDGRFPNSELRSWQRYFDEELKGTGATLLLVEVVKDAGGAPRMYRYGKNKFGNAGVQNVDEGTYMQPSEHEIILASSANVPGTVSPLQVKLRKTLGEAPELAPLAWVHSIFDLSFMHHGSIFKGPKLPITLHFSDRLAYFIATGNIQLDEELEQRMDNIQQWWL